MAKQTICTELPTGARSRGYVVEEDKAVKWFEAVLKQMKAFAIPGSSVLLFEGDVEISRENV